MKPLLWTLSTALFLLVQTTSSQDNSVIVDDSLKAGADIMPVKQKGLSGKFEFGPYKIISTGRGPVKQTNSAGSQLIEGNWWFVLTGDSPDSVVVSLNVSSRANVTESRYWKKEGDGYYHRTRETQVDPQKGEITAVIKANRDSVEWELSYLIDYSRRNGSSIVLSGPGTRIDVKYIKKGMVNLMQLHGYAFLLNDKVIAAIENRSKRIAWIDKSLDPRLKPALAGCIGTMLFIDTMASVE